MTRTLIIGGTGTVGSEVVAQLSDLGVPVRAMVPKPDDVRLSRPVQVVAGEARSGSVEPFPKAVRSGGVARGMRAATVRLCTVAELDEVEMWQHVHIAVRLPVFGGEGRGSSARMIDMAGVR
jgi:hypothetical protein